jgi:hypothetical protein
MKSGAAQFLALVFGAAITAGLLFAVGEAGIGTAVSACQPDISPEARDHAPPRPSLRLSSISLPPPPAAPVVAAAPRPPPRPAARPRARPASPDQRSAQPGIDAPNPSKTAMRTPALNPVPVPLNAGKDQEDDGRPLLKLLEHGQGPLVEISWPGHSVASAKLHDLLRRCHGLKTVLMRGQEILMPAPAGAPEVFNMDRHSGFLRAILGPPPQREARLIKQLRARYGAKGTMPARLLSRQFDARLLGGLRRLAGPGYRDAKAVSARYAVAGARIMVHGILVDGKEIEGRIEIDPPGSCLGDGA